jgi:hypothetical protein
MVLYVYTDKSQVMRVKTKPTFVRFDGTECELHHGKYIVDYNNDMQSVYVEYMPMCYE